MRTLLSGTQHALRAGDYEAVIASVGASLRSLTCRNSNTQLRQQPASVGAAGPAPLRPRLRVNP